MRNVRFDRDGHRECRCVECGEWRIDPGEFHDGLRCNYCAAEDDFTPPEIDCCDSAVATGGAYHAPDCANAHPQGREHGTA